MYGRGYLSSTVSQLLLNLDSSTALRHKVYSTGEAEVIAIGMKITVLIQRLFELIQVSEYICCI